MPSITRIVITLPDDHNPEQADLLLGLLSLRVTHGWEEDALPTGEMRYIVHSSIAEFCRELAEAVAFALPEAWVDLEACEEVDWAEAWAKISQYTNLARDYLNRGKVHQALGVYLCLLQKKIPARNYPDLTRRLKEAKEYLRELKLMDEPDEAPSAQPAMAS